MITNYKTKNEFLEYATNKLGFENITRNIYSPHIVEERELNMITMSVFDRLMVDRIIWVTGVVDSVMADVVQAQLLYLDSVNQLEITMYLNTPGGSVSAGLSIVDTMDIIKSDIKTVNIGMCASMGSVLVGAGTKGKRQTLVNAEVMTHQVSYGISGNVQDNRITSLNAEKTNYLLFKRLAKYSNQPLDKILKDSERDNWMNSDQSVEYGLIDEVIGIDDNTESITEQLDGFDTYYKNILMKLN